MYFTVRWGAGGVNPLLNPKYGHLCLEAQVNVLGNRENFIDIALQKEKNVFLVMAEQKARYSLMGLQEGAKPEVWTAYPRIQQSLCQEVCASANQLSFEVPATDSTLGFVPCPCHDVTPCLLLMPARHKSSDTHELPTTVRGTTARQKTFLPDHS